MYGKISAVSNKNHITIGKGVGGTLDATFNVGTSAQAAGTQYILEGSFLSLKRAEELSHRQHLGADLTNCRK